MLMFVDELMITFEPGISLTDTVAVCQWSSVFVVSLLDVYCAFSQWKDERDIAFGVLPVR